jgi:DNA-binding LytR/AlgR family response regulator
MKDNNSELLHSIALSSPGEEEKICNDLQSLQSQPDTIHILRSTTTEEIDGQRQKSSANGRGNILKEPSSPRLRNVSNVESLISPHQISKNLLRLFIKNGEYVYARPNDIIMIESCDHLVKIFLGFEDKVKKAIRHSTLKDFLLLLQDDSFMRIGRFCAVNMDRISGGNFNDQAFEFDFKISVKLKHPVSHTVFAGIGR